MEIFLSKVTHQAMNFAIRSGISITATYAISQSSRLLKNVSGTDRAELLALQERLQSKIRVISPAIDMIELIAARGNTSLESAVSLTKALRYDIQSLARRLEKAATAEELARKGAISANARSLNEAEIKLIIQDIKRLLNRIEDAVPLMNLAITTSGASLSTTLPSTVSPSRLLQASTFLTACDTQYSMTPAKAVQVGPTFTLSMYMLFSGHLRPHDEESVRETTWKEVMHKARVKIRRVPLDVFVDPTERQASRSHLPATARADEFAYQILIVEDLDDGRVHTFDEDEAQPQPYEGVDLAGIREIIPIHEISKIFYADTGKMLNIGSDGEANNPVLLLKRDVNAIPPRRMVDRNETEYEDFEQDTQLEEYDELQCQLDAQLNGGTANTDHQDYYESLSGRQIPESKRLPPNLDLEWVAFEVYREEEEDDTDAEDEDTESVSVEEGVKNLSVNDNEPSSRSPSQSKQVSFSSSQEMSTPTASNPVFSNIRTSLSLLETLLRLTSLQQFQQQSHLSITDELLNFFLEESSSTGAGGDEQHRQRLRADARRKVGWDPYDESPLKRRGEEYQYQYDNANDGHWTPTGTPARFGYDPPSPGGRTDESYRIRSREHTPEPSPGLPKRAIRPPALAGGKKGSSLKGSPLSKGPTTANTDEGLGTSPGTKSGQ
ncbi:Ran-specific GTPase-activating protein 30 [Talaromyces islandicus]|uniref:Ran-specific GTPase-activating protein 30 n=1 Tax=Talaromyces islandicus TaxID=28573 RepID=A0A0U1M5B8_TALIS|nr:Ran-specific GTPase-activating protein 30 [Talaromyces islandicus]